MHIQNLNWFLPAALLATACASTGNTERGDAEARSSGPGFPGAPATATGLRSGTMDCYYDVANPGGPPVATVETAIESIETEIVGEAVHVRVTLSPSFCDNTYGVNSIGWSGKKGHTFEHLVKSDRINIDLSDAQGNPVLQPTLDYLSSDDGGYRSLGVWDGEGEMRKGDIVSVLEASSSMDRNLNERGYTDYLVDSPATDENYTPNPLAPNWDYRMIYEVWVALDAFGSNGFGEATVDYVHCSPAKGGENTVVVEPDPCPPDWDADCQDGACDSEEPLECNDPDGCGEGVIIE